MLNIVLFALVAAVIAAPAFTTVMLSATYERRYLRSLARKAAAAFVS
jgi:hypothetical protein